MKRLRELGPAMVVALVASVVALVVLALRLLTAGLVARQQGATSPDEVKAEEPTGVLGFLSRLVWYSPDRTAGENLKESARRGGIFWAIVSKIFL